MNIAGIREALRREPFLTFSIGMADGRAFEIRHPEFVILGPRLVTVIADEDTWSVLDPLLMVSLDYVVEGKSPRFGKQRRG
jgi:hypothetical protein